MDNLIYILVICICAPLLLMMLLADTKTRNLLGFMIVGICIAVLASEINTLLKGLFEGSLNLFDLTTLVTPISEEILKALPLLFVAIVITDKREILFAQAMSIGIGFAIMENTYILVQNIQSVSLEWAFTRGFASGLMHSLCTLFVGMGIALVRKRRKLFFTGTFALLVSASIYHSLFNILIQSGHMYLGAFLPIATYIPLSYAYYKRRWYIAKK